MHIWRYVKIFLILDYLKIIFYSSKLKKENLLAIDFVNSLNPVQYEAVIAMGKPLLIIAGAGTGKTRVITYKIAYFIENKIAPWNILAVTFTNKAAQEMKERVQKLVGENVRLNIGTFHSICVRILRSEIDYLGYRSNFVIYDDQDQLTLIKQICKEMNLNDKLHKPKQIASRISSAKNQLWNASKFSSQVSQYYDQIVSQVFEKYEFKMKENNALDFDDLIMHTVHLFQKYPEVLEKYQNLYQHILVDEYQDTNHAQYRLIQLLVGNRSNLCVVGDPDQSIYRWRGADITNILQFEDDYQNVSIIRLEQNYRSTQNILKASNSLIQNNIQRKSKNLWSENPEGEKITVFYGQDEHDESNFVVNKIEDLRRQKGALYSEIVVFYRTHAQSRVIEESMRYAGIPYDIVGGVSFYARKEVKDIVAYLTLLVSPDDEISLRRIINVPARGLGPAALDAIAEVSKLNQKKFNQVVWDSILLEELPQRILERIRKFAVLMEEFRYKLSKIDLASLIREVIEKTNYFQSFEKEEKVVAETRKENVRELVSAAEDFVYHEEEASLEKFLENISLVSSVDQWSDEEQKLTLMTMHSAKGLEFPYVLMIGLEEGLFPHSISSSDPEEIEEERRLCYVGMTRSMNQLFLSHVEQRMLYGKRSYCLPSRFLQEIPRELIQIDSDLGVKDPEHEFEPVEETLPSFSIGQIVEHKKFGRGQVLEVEYNGDDVKLQIMFRSHTKWLMANLGHLKIVEDSVF